MDRLIKLKDQKGGDEMTIAATMSNFRGLLNHRIPHRLNVQMILRKTRSELCKKRVVRGLKAKKILNRKDIKVSSRKRVGG